MKITFSTVFIGLLALPAPVLAQLDSPTPQYSGPSAMIENRGQSGYFSPSPIPLNDRTTDQAAQNRSLQAQQEMIRRRDEITRANERHIIKTNE